MQFVHQEIRVLDYIEGQGQVLGYYTQELHHRGYDKVLCTLPHDGTNTNAITGLKYADHLRDAAQSGRSRATHRGGEAPAAQVLVQRGDHLSWQRCAGLLPREKARARLVKPCG